MLKHTGEAKQGDKVLILGSKGFIGKFLVKHLKEEGFQIEDISSKEIDLTQASSIEALLPKIEECDHLIMLSCLTPDKGKGSEAFLKNMLMGKHVCDALLKASKKPHVIYFSSDSVYNFDKSLVSEDTISSPIDLYGVMHRARELMFQETIADKLCIIRPTLVYGPGDTHNSYGPNRFRREAFKEKNISLFGEGEDTRAHIFIEDLVKLTSLALRNKSVGVLNGAPPESISFMDLAKLISTHFDVSIEIKTKPRMSPMTYRVFDTTRCYNAFPGFVFTPLKDGLAFTIKKMQEDPHA